MSWFAPKILMGETLTNLTYNVHELYYETTEN